MKYNFLKLTVLFFSLLISAPSFAAPIDVTIKFSGGRTVGAFTYDLDKSLCVTPYCAPNVGDDFQGTKYNGLIEDFSFRGFTLISTGAWFDPYAEEGHISKWGSRIPGARGDSDRTVSRWVLSGEGNDYFAPTNQIEMYLSDTDPFKGSWSSIEFLPPSQGAPNGEFITSGGFFTLTTTQIVTTPIPTTIWLFASGFIGLIGFRQKQQKQA